MTGAPSSKLTTTRQYMDILESKELHNSSPDNIGGHNSQKMSWTMSKDAPNAKDTKSTPVQQGHLYNPYSPCQKQCPSPPSLSTSLPNYPYLKDMIRS